MSKSCCKEEDLIETDYGLYCCVECGTINESYIKEVPDFVPHISFINKTTIGYNRKYHNVRRLHTWASYDYYEVRNYNLLKIIEEYNLERKVKDVSKNIFIEHYKKIKTRGKVKFGLVCYSIYKAHLLLKKPVEIDDWIKKLDISINNYNDAVKKVKYKLYYPKDINKFLKKVDNKLNKNDIIKEYNILLSKNKQYNSKTILNYVIYNKLKELDLLSTYKIFKNSKKIDSLVLLK